jgi:hypothetical protein
MKIKKVGKLLKKLNNLFDNIKEEGSISSIEKDLFLAYVKEIYEASIAKEDKETLEQPTSTRVKSQDIETKTLVSEAVDSPIHLDDIPTDEEDQVPQADTPVVDERELRRQKREEERKRREEERRLRTERRRTKEDSTPILEESTQEYVENSAVEEVPVEAHTSENEESASPQEVRGKAVHSKGAETTVNTTVQETVNEVKSPVFSDEMLEIFEETQINEVSDRLSMTPIADLTKAMGINEKIFTVRELFNKDQERFMSTMSHLNSCVNFEEAKQYLLHGIASENGWDEPSKSKKAANFIKLVQRRYRK